MPHTEVELIEKVKVAFAQYYQTDQAIRTTEDLHRVVHDMARVARDRYAQGRGSQPEVYKAEVEITRLSTENCPPRGEAARCRGPPQRVTGPADRRAVSAAGEITAPAFGRGPRASRSDAAGACRQFRPWPAVTHRSRGRCRQAARRQELASGSDVEGGARSIVPATGPTVIWPRSACAFPLQWGLH